VKEAANGGFSVASAPDATTSSTRLSAVASSRSAAAACGADSALDFRPRWRCTMQIAWRGEPNGCSRSLSHSSTLFCRNERGRATRRERAQPASGNACQASDGTQVSTISRDRTAGPLSWSLQLSLHLKADPAGGRPRPATPRGSAPRPLQNVCTAQPMGLTCMNSPPFTNFSGKITEATL
jgi:hypothetical protein